MIVFSPARPPQLGFTVGLAAALSMNAPALAASRPDAMLVMMCTAEGSRLIKVALEDGATPAAPSDPKRRQDDMASCGHALRVRASTLEEAHD